MSSRLIGEIDLMDVEVMSEHQGRDFTPYPFLSADKGRFASYEEFEDYSRTVPDRLMHGDLGAFKPWLDVTLGSPDISLSACIGTPENTSIRLLAVRVGPIGYVAFTSGKPRLKVYETRSVDLGAAIAKLAVFSRPGSHPEVLFRSVTEWGSLDTQHSAGADNAIVSIETHAPAPPPTIEPAQISGFGQIQTNWEPVKEWGFSKSKAVIRWYNTSTGDYLVSQDRTVARPVDRSILHQRIDRSIAEDITDLKRNRGEGIQIA